MGLRGLEVCLVVVLLATVGKIQAEEKKAGKDEVVITLDHSNFDDVVSKHDFILVEFYAPWYYSFYSFFCSTFSASIFLFFLL